MGIRGVDREPARQRLHGARDATAGAAASGTDWSSDPAEGMVTILMTQRTWDTPSPPEILRDFLTSAYQAIGD